MINKVESKDRNRICIGSTGVVLRIDSHKHTKYSFVRLCVEVFSQVWGKAKDGLEQGCHNWSFCKSSGCNCYDFLHLDCHEISLNKLGAESYKF